MPTDSRTRIVSWRQNDQDRGQAFVGPDATARAVAGLTANLSCSDVTVEAIEHAPMPARR